MTKTSGKRPYEMAVKKSISMPAMLFDKSTDRQRQHGYTTYSDYLQSLIRNDVQKAEMAA